LGLSLSRFDDGDINGSKASIDCDTFFFLSFSFFFASVAVAVDDLKASASFYFSALLLTRSCLTTFSAASSLTRRTCDYTVLKGLNSCRFNISTDESSLSGIELSRNRVTTATAGLMRGLNQVNWDVIYMINYM